jgi:class 3 adenylate cyclase
VPIVAAGSAVADRDRNGCVIDRPPTQYARSGDLHVAYQTLGEGPIDIVFVAPGQTSVETAWDVPAMARYLRGLAGIGRLVLFDAIGSGLSDPLPELAHSLDSWTTDVRIVMDAVGLERAVLHCYDSAGTMAMVFAAIYPERVSSLILVNTFAKLRRTDDFPIGVTPEQWSQYREFAVSNWGNGKLSGFFAGSRVDDAELEVLARQERRVFSPGAFGRYLDRELAADVRSALPTIQSPTLILHRAHNRTVDPAHGRYLAEQIPSARYVEVEGTAHAPYEGDTQPILDEIREFLTGHREAANVDRVLATILFTDIVGSTELAADVGDRRWRELLDEHDSAVAATVSRFDGVLVKSTGDGALATFASPGRAIAAAKAIDSTVAGIGLQVRAGLHTGECERRGVDIGGIAVHIAARIAAAAGPGQVLVSRTVTDLVVGADMTFSDAGEHELKGVPGSWHLFTVD